MAVHPANPVGFFPSWPEVFDSTGLPFQQEEEEVEVETTVRGESDILPEAGTSMVEALGGPVKADCSRGPLLVGAAQVEVPVQVHSEWQYSG